MIKGTNILIKGRRPKSIFPKLNTNMRSSKCYGLNLHTEPTCEMISFHGCKANSIHWWKPCDTVKSSRTDKLQLEFILNSDVLSDSETCQKYLPPRILGLDWQWKACCPTYIHPSPPPHTHTYTRTHVHTVHECLSRFKVQWSGPSLPRADPGCQ